MPPCVVDAGNAEGKKAVSALQLNSLKKAIPEEAFKKSFVLSTLYMLFDFGVWAGSVYAMNTLCNSPIWATLPFWQQALATGIFWTVTGTYMWTIFLIGHDCGHGTYCDSELINDIIGHIVHGTILVPYHPWQLSHRRHHMYHNHVEKDYSHPWYTPERLARPDEYLARFVHNNALIRILFPLYGWPVYIYGMPDGSHLFPFPSQRMWKDSPTGDYVRCIISLVNVIAWVYFMSWMNNFELAKFAFYYLAPWVVFGWWLVTVTYLQHHDPSTLVYDDSDWKFVDAAFETVDRKYGWGLDTLLHHITDGHVAHHLFFTKIPHYNLPIATKAIKEYMNANNLGWMYKCDDTSDFIIRVHKYFIDFGFKSHRASPARIADKKKKAN